MQTKCATCGEILIHKAKPKKEIDKAITCNACRMTYDVTDHGELVPVKRYAERLSDYYIKFKQSS